MLEKNEILILIFFLLILFYLVISFGAKKKNISPSPEIKNYLFGVRILISFIGIVAFILWFFL